MNKTLTLSFEDIEQANTVQLSGTLNPDAMAEHVILSVGTAKIVINSKDLRLALDEVVSFQSKFEVKE